MRRFFFTIFQLSSILIFSISVFAAILFAEGYNYDLEIQDFVKKSVIFFEGLPQDVEVFLDGEFREVTFPPGEIRILPGVYNLEIKKSGYFIWRKQVFIQKDTILRIPEPILEPILLKTL